MDRGAPGRSLAEETGARYVKPIARGNVKNSWCVRQAYVARRKQCMINTTALQRRTKMGHSASKASIVTFLDPPKNTGYCHIPAEWSTTEHSRNVETTHSLSTYTSTQHRSTRLASGRVASAACTHPIDRLRLTLPQLEKLCG